MTDRSWTVSESSNLTATTIISPHSCGSPSPPDAREVSMEKWRTEEANMTANGKQFHVLVNKNLALWYSQSSQLKNIWTRSMKIFFPISSLRALSIKSNFNRFDDRLSSRVIDHERICFSVHLNRLSIINPMKERKRRNSQIPYYWLLLS